MQIKKEKLHEKIFFMKNICLSTKFDLWLKQKETKTIGAISILLGNIFFRHQKSASQTIFQKKKHRFFFVTRLFYLIQIAAETSSNLFSRIF